MLIEESLDDNAASLQSRPEWQLARRIASSKRLRKSDLLPKFLMYVCEQQLMGTGHEITEQRIGTQIFNRPGNYNPGEDNIVRSYARLLRKRLEEYFDEEGTEEAMRIVIPRGGYVPVFSSGTVEQPVSSVSSQTEEDRPADVDDHTLHPTPKAVQVGMGMQAIPRKSAWISPLLGLVVGILLTSLAWLKVGRSAEGKTPGPARVIWSQIFQRNRDTLIVPADSGLGILQNLTGHLVGLEEYANGTYLTDVKPLPVIGLGNLNDLRRQRYTSVVDLNITAMLTQLPEFAGSRSQIRYARSITTEDLKHSNAILLGSVHTNPWVTLFEKDLNFKLEYTPEVDQSFRPERAPCRPGAHKISERNCGRWEPDLRSNRLLVEPGWHRSCTDHPGPEYGCDTGRRGCSIQFKGDRPDLEAGRIA